MGKYNIQHKIASLADCATQSPEQGSLHYSFTVEDITFEPWEFNIRDGWTEDAWKATAEIVANDFREGINAFRKKLDRIIPRVSLIAQSFIQFRLEPFVIHKNNSDFAYFQYISDRSATGLMFMEDEKKALDELLTTDTISEEFYRYWNDIVNTSGYSPKLLAMCAALESLTKTNGKKDFVVLESILGKELKEELFGTKENSQSGLRHRLAHGEYFSFPADGTKNYVEDIHDKVLQYFNTKVLSKPLLNTQVVQPQRHPWGNKVEWHGFIKKLESGTFDLKDVLEVYDESNGWKMRDKYDDNFDDQGLYKTY
jgi:hypothetical protein